MFRHFRFLTVVAVAHLLCLSSIAQTDAGLLERASTGDATAMHLIGRAAAADGKPVEAYAWFSLSFEHGVVTSEKSALFNELNSAQVTKATQRIEEIRSTLLRGLPRPPPKPVTRVVDAKRPAEGKPVAPPAATPAKAQPALDGQVEAQKAQIAKLEADVAAARSEAGAAKAQSGEWTTSLEAALAQANQERDARSRESTALRQDKIRAEESLAQMRVDLSTARSKQEADVATARSEARAAKAQSGESTTRLEAALARAAQERDALSGEIAALRQDKLRAEESLAQMRAQPALDGQVEAQKVAIAKLESDLAGARIEVRAAKDQSSESTTRLEAALAQANLERDTRSGEIATLRQDRLRAEEARDQMRVDLSTVRSKLAADLAAARSEARAAKAEATSLGEALRRSEMKVDTTVRAFSVIEQENERLQARMREADAKTAAAERAGRNDSSEIERLRGELARTEQARTAALASRETAIRDLSATQNRNDNLVRELSRARPGMLMESDSTPRAAPMLPSESVPVGIPTPVAAEARMHAVAAGETLSIISDQYYKTPSRWREIFNANKDVMKSENHLVPGMKLRIP